MIQNPKILLPFVTLLFQDNSWKYFFERQCAPFTHLNTSWADCRSGSVSQIPEGRAVSCNKDIIESTTNGYQTIFHVFKRLPVNRATGFTEMSPFLRLLNCWQFYLE